MVCILLYRYSFHYLLLIQVIGTVPFIVVYHVSLFMQKNRFDVIKLTRISSDKTIVPLRYVYHLLKQISTLFLIFYYIILLLINCCFTRALLVSLINHECCVRCVFMGGYLCGLMQQLIMRMDVASQAFCIFLVCRGYSGCGSEPVNFILKGK